MAFQMYEQREWDRGAHLVIFVVEGVLQGQQDGLVVAAAVAEEHGVRHVQPLAVAGHVLCAGRAIGKDRRGNQSRPSTCDYSRI